MSSSQNDRGLQTIPFHILNQSGIDAPLYIWVQGLIPNTNQYVYLSDLKGTMTDTPNGSSNATFSMLLPDKESEAILPQLIALRVYLSFGNKLFTTVDVFLAPASSAAVTMANLTGHPGITVPCGFADDLPVGLMTTGPLYGEAAVLRAAAAFEAATDWHLKRP